MYCNTMTSADDRDASVAAAAPPPPGLAELQAMFQNAVLGGDDTLLDLVPGNSRTGAATLLGVYRHAYWLRLLDIIRNDHGALESYVGSEMFEAMARDYIAAHPSDQPNARWVSRHLPAFLAETEPYAVHAEIAEIAALERALNDAFDAADAPALSVAALAEVPPEHWHDLVFTPPPSARRLTTNTNALDLWLALRDAATPPDTVELPASQQLLVWRDGVTSKVRLLPSEEAMLWDEAGRGASFGALCALAATFDDPDGSPLRVAGYLQGWIATGLLASAAIT